jgi:hypothetical protein
VFFQNKKKKKFVAVVETSIDFAFLKSISLLPSQKTSEWRQRRSQFSEAPPTTPLVSTIRDGTNSQIIDNLDFDTAF